MNKQRLVLLIPLLLFLSLGIFLWRGLNLNPRLLPSALLNKPVPHFILPNLLQPHEAFTDQHLQQGLVLLNVWATWCVNCQLEHPVLVDIANNQHIPIYGLDYKDSSADASRWLAQYGNPYRAIGVDTNGNTAINLGVYGTPETFIIDNGIIRYKFVGPITKEVWQNTLSPEIKALEKSTL